MDAGAAEMTDDEAFARFFDRLVFAIALEMLLIAMGKRDRPE